MFIAESENHEVYTLVHKYHSHKKDFHKLCGIKIQEKEPDFGRLAREMLTRLAVKQTGSQRSRHLQACLLVFNSYGKCR